MEGLYAALFELLPLTHPDVLAAEDQHVALRRAHQLGIERQAQAGVEHHAQQRTPPRPAGAVGEQRVVGQHGADAGEDGVGLVAQALDVRAGFLPGNPALAGFGRSGGGDFSVEGQAGFQRHQRPPGANPTGEGFVQAAGFFCAGAGDDFDPGGAQALEASAVDLRVGIGHGRYHAANAGGDDGFDAGRRAAAVRAGFQVGVEGGAARGFSRRFQRQHFGVFQAVVGVEGAGDFLLAAHQHGTHQRIGTGQCFALRGQLQRHVHPFVVSADPARGASSRVDGHGSLVSCKLGK